jgi:hypothetical protein
MSVPMSSEDPIKATPDQRKSRLAQAVQQEVVQGGRVESQGDYNAVIRHGKSVNHVLHLILTLVTLGTWSIVWLIMFIISATSNKTITLNVDDFGNLLRQQV